MSAITTSRENGRVLLEQVADVLEAYREHLPLTVRQVFYRLVAEVGYDKSERAYASPGRSPRQGPPRSRGRLRDVTSGVCKPRSPEDRADLHGALPPGGST